MNGRKRLGFSLHRGLLKLHVFPLHQVPVRVLIFFRNGDPRVVDENVLVIVGDETESGFVVVPFYSSDLSHIEYWSGTL